MVAGGPIYFFQTDESEFVRRPRKSLSLVESLEDDSSNIKQDSVKVAKETTTDASKTRPGTITEPDLVDEAPLPLTQDLISKIEEDAKVFLQDGLSLSCNTPSLHKFLPLLKQAIQTFDMIDPAPLQKMTLHEKYHILKSQSGDILKHDTIYYYPEIAFKSSYESGIIYNTPISRISLNCWGNNKITPLIWMT